MCFLPSRFCSAIFEILLPYSINFLIKYGHKVIFAISHYENLPQGWIECTLGNIGSWSSGATPSRSNKMYYTNFEVCNVNWFSSDEYMNFYNKIDESGGIMTHRWGDAPIRYLGVNMYMNPENIYGFENIDYQHGSFRTN